MGTETLVMNSHFRPGDLVQVRSAEEILATLDQNGTLDGIPFMPEMATLCGRQFRVAKRAHKTCEHGLHRVTSDDVVHLAGVRCDGSAHGGCQYQCLMFWKEAWLKRAAGTSTLAVVNSAAEKTLCSLSNCEDPPGETRYKCQATEIPKFSVPLRFREADQFVSDIRSGNVRWRELRVAAASAYDYFSWLVYRFMHRNDLRQRKRRPAEAVHFKPGDIVRVKSRKQIFDTVDYNRTTRGLELSIDMLRFCGKELRVGQPVQRIIDVNSGYIKELKNECIVLDGVSCGGSFMMCPHNYYHFWRADWLELRSPARTEGGETWVSQGEPAENGAEQACALSSHRLRHQKSE